MNKTTTINLSGQVFNIDDDAYELLKEYLERVRAALKDDEDRDEIMQDFEHAVAEHLLEALSDKSAVVTNKLVKQVTKSIGEYETSETEQPASSNETQDQAKPDWHGLFKHPIYLDKKNALLGGVCAGIARSLEVDAFWVRLAFVILTFLSWGVGLIGYVVLALIMKDPQNVSDELAASGVRPTAAALVAHSKQRFQAAQANLAQADVGAKLTPVGTFLKNLVRFVVATGSVIGITLVTILYVILTVSWVAHRHSAGLPFSALSPLLSYVLIVSSFFVLILPLVLLLLVAVARRIARKALTARLLVLVLLPWLIALTVCVGAVTQAVPRLSDWSKQHPNNQYFQLKVQQGHLDVVCVNLGGHCNDQPVCVYAFQPTDKQVTPPSNPAGCSPIPPEPDMPALP